MRDDSTVIIEPLAQVQIDPLLAGLPKADLHVHQEAKARFERVVADRRGQPPYDRRDWARRVVNEWPPGMGRLDALYEPDAALDLGGESDLESHNFVARIVDLLEEEAADGAVLVEVRFGAGLAQPDFMALFRGAEREVRGRFPQLRAEAIGFVNLVNRP